MLKSKISVSLVTLLMASSSLVSHEGLVKDQYSFERGLVSDGQHFSTLLIGMNYEGSQNELQNCIHDIEHVIQRLLVPYLGLSEDHMIVMTDEEVGDRYPVARNIRTQFKNFVANLNQTKHGYFHYSGHGSTVRDTTGDESDGQDEVLCPLDIDQGRYIVDDEVFNSLILPLKSDVQLTVAMDCCHSGTILDLPYTWNMDGTYQLQHRLTPTQFANLPDVVAISGCLDNQTSADGAPLEGVGDQSGAMTAAFLTVLKRHNYNLSYRQLVTEMNQFLQKYRYTQRVQLSSTRMLNLDDPFIAVSAQLRG